MDLNLVIPTAAGLGGVLLGAWLTSRHAKNQSKLAFIDRQLSEFYSTLVGIRREIRALSEFRLEVDRSAHDVWKELCEVARVPSAPEEFDSILDPEQKYLKTRIEYNNSQLADRLIPGYQKMVAHFRDNYWLAESSTRDHFVVLVRFVETWDRFLSETHSPELLRRVDVKEALLEPLYKDLDEVHDVLREKLQKGKA